MDVTANFGYHSEKKNVSMSWWTYDDFKQEALWTESVNIFGHEEVGTTVPIILCVLLTYTDPRET